MYVHPEMVAKMREFYGPEIRILPIRLPGDTGGQPWDLGTQRGSK
jgi:hypothetical protein